MHNQKHLCYRAHLTDALVYRKCEQPLEALRYALTLYSRTEFS